MTAQIERSPWRYRTERKRVKRDAAIMRMYRQGIKRQIIAAAFDLTPARITQIVTGAGGTFR